MIKTLELMLDGPGIVFFDPFTLDTFLKSRDVSGSNLFQLFIDAPEIGDEIIRQGIILPIYTIPPIDYQIVLNDSGTSTIRPDWLHFSSKPFPLAIGESGKVVAADIYSIMDWEAGFYQQLFVDGPIAPQAAATVLSGNYSVVINGFAEREYVGRGPKEIGYELLLQKVDSLPVVPPEIDIESTDFVLWQPG